MGKPTTAAAFEILKAMHAAAGIRPVNPDDFDIVSDEALGKTALDEHAARVREAQLGPGR